MQKLMTLILGALAVCGLPAAAHASNNAACVRAKPVVDGVVAPLMKKDTIPGMAISLVVAGHPCTFSYGVASLETRRPVTAHSLFELGSVSKTFTATLAALAQAQNKVSLANRVDAYLPVLRGSAFGATSLIELATHTPGGLPLQVPKTVHTDLQLMGYLKAWRPTCAPGTCRTYSNVGIGTLGLAIAEAEHKPFTRLMRQQVFSPLGMHHTWYAIPKASLADYAQGYTTQGAPIRMTPGVLDAEAYGVKSSAADMQRFLEANLGLIHGHTALGRAIATTHTGYFKVGAMTQDLVWEQYRYPVALHALLEGNSPHMIFDAVAVTRMTPPSPPRRDVWINKTGSTNGFGTYVAFVPAKRSGIVLLANKSYPISDRVTAAHEILTRLDPQ